MLFAIRIHLNLCIYTVTYKRDRIKRLFFYSLLDFPWLGNGSNITSSHHHASEKKRKKIVQWT